MKLRQSRMAALLACSLIITSAQSAEAKELIIAVIDTGLDHGQSLFKNRLWTNPGESGLDAHGRDRSSNGIDDDGNGWVDDVHGWNFVRGNPRLQDDHGHGTHITALILAGQGLQSSLPPNAKIMTLKYYETSATETATMKAAEEALDYAIKMNADVINFSGGGQRPSPRERELLRLANRRGILLVAAAGNDGINNDRVPFFPASYDLPNILAVTGADAHGRLLPTSNFGSRRVSISAPGENIVALLPGGGKGAMTGTSQATAIVTHEIVKTWIQRPDLRSPEDLIRQIELSGRYDPRLLSRTRSATHLDAGSLRTQRNQGVNYRDQPLTWDLVLSTSDTGEATGSVSDFGAAKESAGRKRSARETAATTSSENFP